MDDHATDLAADLSEAMGDTSTQSAGDSSAATVDTPAQPGAATTEPAVGATADTLNTEPAKAGPIPFDDHKKILENARSKAVQEWEQQYGWAKQVDRASVEQAARLGNLYQTDRAAFVRELIGSTPDPALVSEFARVLAGRRGQGAAAETQEPQPDLPIEFSDGRVVHLYSAEQQARRDAWREQRMLAQLEQKYAPALQSADELRAAKEHVARVAQANNFATGFTGDLAKLPHFAEIKGDVYERLKATNIPEGAPPEAVEAVTLRIYAQVLGEKVLPNLQQAQTRKVLNDIHQKADVNTASPSAPSAGTPKSYADMTWEEAFTHELAAAKR